MLATINLCMFLLGLISVIIFLSRRYSSRSHIDIGAASTSTGASLLSSSSIWHPYRRPADSFVAAGKQLRLSHCPQADTKAPSPNKSSSLKTMYARFPEDDRERSYGIIPLRFTEDGGTEVLIIQHRSTGEYGFPKGHAEPEDADPLTAAKRELLEETGVTVKNLLFDPYTTYFESTYTNPRTGKAKTTTVWAAQIDSKAAVTIQPEEILSYVFVDVRKAHEVLSFAEDRESMVELIRLLDQPSNGAGGDDDTYPQMVLFGDSITQQAWMPGGLGQQLANWYQRRMDILNRGFSGYNTRWAIYLLPHIFPPPTNPLAPSTKLVTIWLGANDAIYPGTSQHCPLQEYETNLRRIILHIHTNLPHAGIILITPPPVIPPVRQWEAAEAYAKVVRNLAVELLIPCVDAFGLMETNARELGDGNVLEGLRSLLSDGLHLLPAGYQIVYDEVQAIIQRSFPELIRDNLAMMFPHGQTIENDGIEEAFRRAKHYRPV